MKSEIPTEAIPFYQNIRPEQANKLTMIADAQMCATSKVYEHKKRMCIKYVNQSERRKRKKRKYVKENEKKKFEQEFSFK